jgi:hypothetical protein
MLYQSVRSGEVNLLICKLGLLAALAVTTGCGNSEQGTVQLPAGTRERLAPQANAPKNKDGTPGETKILSIKDLRKGPSSASPTSPPAQ